MISLFRSLRRLVRPWPDRIRELPILVVMPHGGCNCRCIMCDIWKAPDRDLELPVERVARELDSLRALRTRSVILSGGEPLLHSRLGEIWQHLRTLRARVSLLSNGLLLDERAQEIAQTCNEVIVSLDGPEELHDAIRGVPGTFRQLAAGVERLRSIAPELGITGRAVIQKSNFDAFPRIIDAAHELGLDRISFLAVDVATQAFNRRLPLRDPARARMLLDEDEIDVFGEIIERTAVTHQTDFSSGYVAESPGKLRRLHRYFEAAGGRREFSAPPCNAPWVSAVIEADGAVRPCFFHAPYGNLRDAPLEAILNSPDAVSFRENLQVKTNPICRTCVCPLYLRSAGELAPGRD